MTALQAALSNRKLYRDVSVTKFILTTDNHSVTPLRLITCLPGYSIFIQRINSIPSAVAGTTSTIQSSNATPAVVTTFSNAATSPFFRDFDEAGVQLAEGEHLEYVNSAAGAALVVWVQAYMKPTAASLVAKTAGATSGFQTTL